jgi:hypothetical protein
MVAFLSILRIWIFVMPLSLHQYVVLDESKPCQVGLTCGGLSKHFEILDICYATFTISNVLWVSLFHFNVEVIAT